MPGFRLSSHTLGCAEHFRTTFTVDGRRDDASGIAGTFAARIKSLHLDVAQGGRIAQDAHGGRGACFSRYHNGLVGQEAVAATAKGFEAFREARGNEAGHPEVEWGGDEAGAVA